MSKLYRLSIEPNIVEEKTVEHYYQDEGNMYDGAVTTTKKLQDGWKITRYEVEFDFSEEEVKFYEAWSKIRKGNAELDRLGVYLEVEPPTSIKITIGEPRVSEMRNLEKVVIRERTEDFATEKVWVFIREGMSTNILVSRARAAELEAPIKTNRKEGPTLRGYAATLVQDEAAVDKEFYSSILDELS